MWTEDPGEWETLPYPLERRININDKTIHLRRETIDEWVKRRYLAGKRRETKGVGDPWTDIAQYRGGYFQENTIAGPDGIKIDLAGSSPDATYISAVLLSPPEDLTALDFVNSERARAVRSQWPVKPLPPRGSSDLTVQLTQNKQKLTSLGLSIPAGSGSRTDIDLVSISPTKIKTIQADFNSDLIRPYIWAALRTLERLKANSNLLQISETRLVEDTTDLPVSSPHPRRLVLWIDISSQIPPGKYEGNITIGWENGSTTLPVSLTVPNISLPKAKYPAGFYLDEMIHLTWAFQSPSRRAAQIKCDLEFMTTLGLSSLAPPLQTPLGAKTQEFMLDLKAATNISPQRGQEILAYTPAKRLKQNLGNQAAAYRLNQLIEDINSQGLTAPYWSVADEPSNPHLGDGSVESWIKVLRDNSKNIKLAAQLNTPKDIELASLFDLVLINDGFDLTPRTVQAFKSKGPEVWLYNTGRIRETAAIGMRVTKATAYVQWHARMPTADPFDPTDGREGDVMMLLPSAEICKKQPDINLALLHMAEGLVDQRWLLLLDQEKSREAQSLKRKLWKSSQNIWLKKGKRNNINLDSIRLKVQQYFSKQ
ncbi:hypothetical protein [Flexibacterium corallicola]|uniref:hypothetical protein n=1 Tax=Flexibacterium corallicola TaxID=3037259 RepID=UPI00286EC076|nr:hypothetical protein [Pseudovibrio sp. M1P-2-3]